jgi:membrane-associated phospholipid phosphatase
MGFFAPKDRAILTLQVLYLIGISLLCIFRSIQPTPETLFLTIAGIFVWRSQTRAFIKDFFPFLLMLLAWQGMRGYADNLSPNRILIIELIRWEEALFGVVPAVWLRENVWGAFATPFFNGISHFFYLSHFVTPVAVAALLWQKKRELFRPFMAGLMALTYAGFITYLLVPAAPPWLASQWGYLTTRTPVLLWGSFPTALQMVSPNHVAAMPSLHAAYPTFIACFCVWVWGKQARWTFVLPLMVCFAAVWLGHHYVIDLLAGMFYAAAAVWGTVYWVKRTADLPLAQTVPAAMPEWEPAGD